MRHRWPAICPTRGRRKPICKGWSISNPQPSPRCMDRHTPATARKHCVSWATSCARFCSFNLNVERTDEADQTDLKMSSTIRLNSFDPYYPCSNQVKCENLETIRQTWEFPLRSWFAGCSLTSVWLCKYRQM